MGFHGIKGEEVGFLKESQDFLEECEQNFENYMLTCCTKCLQGRFLFCVY